MALAPVSMPIEPTSIPGLYSNDDAERLRAHVQQLLFWGRMYWKPLHDRMDYSFLLYLLLDPIQQAKQPGYRRFVSNDPRTAIDTAVNLLTRNYPYWRGDMPTGMNPEERAKVGKIEQTLSGIIDALDSLFRHRGDPGGSFWRQAAFFALMRGWIWGKFQITDQATKWGLKTPLLGEFFDPKQVFPHYDQIGLASVIVVKETNMAEMMQQYGSKVQAALQNSGKSYAREQIDPNATAIRIEYWSNDRYDENTGEEHKGCYGILGYMMTSSVEAGIEPVDVSSQSGFSTWLVTPREHGYAPDALPIIGVPVNGIPIKSKPQFGQGLLASMNLRATRLGLAIPTWHGPNGWVAESGRGLLTAVEEHIPQYNELMATVFQHFTANTYGTLVFKTQTGELPDYEDGSMARIPLRIGEDVQRFEPHPINNDAYKLLGVLQDERQRGMLNSILQADGAIGASSGIVLSQAINAALNSLHAFATGLEDFGTMFQEHILEQLRTSDAGTMTLVARGSNKSYVRVSFDPKLDLEDRKYHMTPVFKPAVPEDIMTKAQAATLLLNPRNPIMSVVTVLDQIFQLEDPEGEMLRMLEDVANRDPVLLLERIATLLEEEGEPDMAQRIRQKEFQAKFADQLQQQQMEAQKAQLDAQKAQIDAQAASSGGPAGASSGAVGTNGPGSSGGAEPNPLDTGSNAAAGGGAIVNPGAGGPDLNPGGGLGVIGQ